MKKDTTTALFVGTFDPFTLGHYDVVKRALTFCDRVVVGVCVNAEKKNTLHSSDERLAAIEQVFEDEPRVQPMVFHGLVVELAKMVGAKCIVKGVRSVHDFEYEQVQAEINRKLTGVETLLLPADPALASLSSSMVRELMRYGQDVAAFLPQPVYKLYQGQEKNE